MSGDTFEDFNADHDNDVDAKLTNALENDDELILAHGALLGRVDPFAAAMVGTPSGTPLPPSMIASTRRHQASTCEFASTVDGYRVVARLTSRSRPMGLTRATTRRRV